MKVSQRFHNDTYAPGIATYGITGKTGEQGTSGVSMFFTTYLISDDTQFKTFAQKITSRMLPTDIEDIVLDRLYMNGDAFVTPNGEVYLLTDIDTLSTASRNNTLTNIRDSVIKQIGKFDSERSPFNTENKHLFEKEYLTIKDSGTATSNNNGNAKLNIIKNNASGTGNLKFIDMQALYGSQADINLEISYDNKAKAFMIDSQYPIIIRGNLYVNSTTTVTTQTTEYSPVLTTNNAITDFVGVCNEYTFDINSSIYSYTKPDSSTVYYGSIYIITLNDESENTDENIHLDRYYQDTDVTVHFQNKEYQDFQLYRTQEHTYMFKQEYDYVKLNALINKIAYTDLDNIQISLINNFECYLKANKKEITGFNINKS